MAPSDRTPDSAKEPPDKLSALYHSLGRESSPQQLDDLILNQAKAQLSHTERPQQKELKTLFTWERFVSVAAVMVLSVYIVLDVSTEKALLEDRYMDDSMTFDEVQPIDGIEMELDDAVLEAFESGAAADVDADAEAYAESEESAAPLARQVTPLDRHTAERIAEPSQQRLEGQGLEEKSREAKNLSDAAKIAAPEEAKARVNSAAPRPPEPPAVKESKVDQRIFMDAAPQAAIAEQLNTLESPRLPQSAPPVVDQSAQLDPQEAPFAVQGLSTFSAEPLGAELEAADDFVQSVPVTAGDSVELEDPPLEKPISELQKRLDEIERIYVNGDVAIAKLAYAQLRIDYKEVGLPVELETYLKQR